MDHAAGEVHRGAVGGGVLEEAAVEGGAAAADCLHDLTSGYVGVCGGVQGGVDELRHAAEVGVCALEDMVAEQGLDCGSVVCLNGCTG